MIPFDPSALATYFLLLLAIGGVCALVLLAWWLRLALSPRARQAFARHRLSRSLLMIGCLVGVAWPVYSHLRMQRIQQEVAEQIDQEEAERMPTLTQDTVLAGIAMPAGTQLELLHHGAVGKQWVKPEYFEAADFPKPIKWQGVSIKRISRSLQSHQDNSPESFSTTRVTWGPSTHTELAVPQTIDGFFCHSTAGWLYHPNGDENSWDYRDDAAQPFPSVYRFDGCLLAGQDFRDETGKLKVHAPADNPLTRNRWLDDNSPVGHVDTWIITGAAQLTSHQLELVLGSVDLHKERHTLWRLIGQVAKARDANCPLPVGSYVLWQHTEPDTLGVYVDDAHAAANISSIQQQCGGLRIRQLAKPPSL